MVQCDRFRITSSYGTCTELVRNQWNGNSTKKPLCGCLNTPLPMCGTRGKEIVMVNWNCHFSMNGKGELELSYPYGIELVPNIWDEGRIYRDV